MNEILEGLNPAQKEAVETLTGPVLILAGAGSGKTKTLTHRIANLIAHGVTPTRILAVTFTNKAAREMRGRLWRLLYTSSSGWGSSRPSLRADGANSRAAALRNAPNWNKSDLGSEPPRSFMPYMGTFHGICVKILRMEAEAAGLDREFLIYDMDDQITLIKRIVKNLQLPNNRDALKPKSIQAVISMEKNQGNGPDDYLAKAMYPNQYTIAKVFERYEEEKRKAGALDFDDLLLRTLELFAKNAEVRKKWREKFQHILIDEYQDTNLVQYKLVKLLVNEESNICVVGDDWQSIYSWRGADFTNILNFEKDFPGAKVVKLEQNYRSTGNILEASQKIINQNKTRTEKTLFTEAEKGEPVEIQSAADENQEAKFVAQTILRLTREYPDFSNFAVLYRKNSQSLALEKVFINAQIPYKIVGGVRFYDRKEVKDVLAILKLIVSGRDKVSFERVVKNVLSGIGEVSLGKILKAMDAYEGAEPLKDEDFAEILTAAKARTVLKRLIGFLKSTKSDENPGETVKKAVEYFDFRRIVDDGTPSSEERMANLEVLAANAEAYENLEDFLADASLMSSADENSGVNSVTLMTMHAAKGLEFPVVFMVGMEEGVFPGGRVDDEADLEEERRLAYVGMTRAMKKLYLTYAMSRHMYGSQTFSTPSRFLMELGYNPYNNYRDEDGDGFTDFGDDEFGESDFDPFPEDVPVWE